MARLLVLAVVGLAAAPLPAWAGSATAQSIWNMGHALGQAKSQVPNGATVTGTCNADLRDGGSPLDLHRYLEVSLLALA